MDKKRDCAVLVGLNSPAFSEDAAVSEATLDELEELLNTAGGDAVARVIQNRQSPEPKTLLGKGKAAEIAELAGNLDATLIVFDNELTPAQTRNLEDIIGVHVIDRSTLILDIFASRAATREGKLQVELAQYKYLLPRLTGMGISLSRLGGGIGTRGPGESKLETDRRHIHRHLAALREELADVRKNRSEQRRARVKREIPLVAIVGYTNAGKSTLLNTLTNSEISAQNRLFDTLDPTTRRYAASDTLEVILSDTVGFIRKLPHHLIDAFKATLEELTFADLILHVIDASNPAWPDHVRVVDSIVTELGAGEKPVITVFNKLDVCTSQDALPHGDGIVAVCARDINTLEPLRAAICGELSRSQKTVALNVPYANASVLDML
ncbi:MAG: GTPase HflX, partial [Clostridia bacterium]